MTGESPPRRRTALLLSLAGAGLALYLWPAVAAPVVTWADSQVDLRAAREGVGLWKPVRPDDRRWIGVHPLKPGYLLYLRGASVLVPGVDGTRSIVIVQSVLLWASIAGGAVLIARRRGWRVGAIAYVLLNLFLPLRDSASAVMPEAISAALFVLTVALVVADPGGRRAVIAVAAILFTLFWIRPNVGGLAFVLVASIWAFQRRWRRMLGLAGAFCVPVLCVWMATRPMAGPDPGRDIADIVLFGSSEYDWAPSLLPWPAVGTDFLSDPRIREAVANWKTMLAAHRSDRNRELFWRALHGFFGLDYYDARWSSIYRAFELGMRPTLPLFVLAALAAAVAVPGTHRERPWAFAAVALFLLLVVHDLCFAANPRLLLPFLPGLLLLGAAACEIRPSTSRLAAAAALLVFGIVILETHSSVLSRDWGIIEQAGVVIEQRIPRGSLPASAPAVLHVRIAPPVVSPAHVLVELDGVPVYDSRSEADRSRPIIGFPIPPGILAENFRRPSRLRLRSFGDYGPYSYLIFSVIPAPWGRGGLRDASSTLSPRSDVPAGALDWWAHSGEDVPRPPPKSR